MHREEAERAANKAIEAMEMWLQNAGLSLAPQKTEAVLVSSCKVLEAATIRGKAAATIRGLARILLNSRGPKQNRRRFLVSVASAQILYAAPIWAEAMNTPSYRRGTVSDGAILVIAGMVPLKERARELKELKETRASNEGAGGTPNTAAREDAKERSLTAWQDCWDASTKGRWTHTLIPNLRRWVLRSHGQVVFYLTQVLSGHGCFGPYLKRFGHAEDDW
ncbi:uncharacterized protein [Drosophila bipectinata]|uniref:uncharacterized protein n=1 Tax=Drosophila bipectinata TaxID=42026 RepID=UPI001C89E2E0|nr:uncharacterized protein LOC122322120 [Drosophila bipectinata]